MTPLAAFVIGFALGGFAVWQMVWPYLSAALAIFEATERAEIYIKQPQAAAPMTREAVDAAVRAMHEYVSAHR